jgi:hypothetical protein
MDCFPAGSASASSRSGQKPQIEGQGQGGIAEQHPRRVVRKLPVGTEDQDARHHQRPTRAWI